MAKKLAEHTPGRKIFSSKIATVVVWFVTFVWTVPTLGLLVTSFKDDKKILGEAWWISLLHPDFTFANYKGVFLGDGTESLSAGVLPYFINSIVITLPATIFPIAIATMAAYALAMDSIPRQRLPIFLNICAAGSVLCRWP